MKLEKPLSIVFFILLMGAVIFPVSHATAQGRPAKKAIRERIEARHVAFITDRLNLSPELSQVFWPVYHEYLAKRKAISKKYATSKQKMNDDPGLLTTEELNELADSELNMEGELHSLKMEYHARLKAIIGPGRMIRLYEAERQFKKILLKRLQEFRSAE